MRLIVCRVAIALRPFQILQAILDPLESRSLETGPHDAEPIADPRADLAIDVAIGHGTNGHAQGFDDLIEVAQGGLA